jgi:Flp pilus assembly protein TadD
VPDVSNRTKMRHASASKVARQNPTERRGFANRAIVIGLPVTLLVAVVVGGIAWRVHQNRRSAMYREIVETTRVHLQLAENEKALDALSTADDLDAPPEYRYLRSITLSRLGRQEAADSEIRRAIEAAPENPKYKALELKYRMFARERSAIDQLIELHRAYASVAEIAFFSIYGFQAKAILLASEQKPAAADFHQRRKEESLATALTLADEMPELLPELLLFAIQEKKNLEALELIDKQYALRPDSLEIRGRKIATLMALQRPDDAALIAGEMFEESDKNVEAAVYYASTLAQTARSDEHDEALLNLVQTYPTSTDLVSRYAIYLTRTNRLTEARKQIERSMKRQMTADARQKLAFLAITLPLELNSPVVADEELAKYRTSLLDGLLVKYFEARILYLRSNYKEAAKLMIEIVQSSRTNDGRATPLSEDALVWVRQILQDSALNRHLSTAVKVAEDAEKNAPFDLKVVDDGTGGKTDASPDAIEKAVAPPAESAPEPDAPTGSTKPTSP